MCCALLLSRYVSKLKFIATYGPKNARTFDMQRAWSDKNKKQEYSQPSVNSFAFLFVLRAALLIIIMMRNSRAYSYRVEAWSLLLHCSGDTGKLPKHLITPRSSSTLWKKSESYIRAQTMTLAHDSFVFSLHASFADIFQTHKLIWSVFVLNYHGENGWKLEREFEAMEM